MKLQDENLKRTKKFFETLKWSCQIGKKRPEVRGSPKQGDNKLKRPPGFTDPGLLILVPRKNGDDCHVLMRLGAA